MMNIRQGASMLGFSTLIYYGQSENRVFNVYSGRRLYASIMRMNNGFEFSVSIRRASISIRLHSNTYVVHPYILADIQHW